MVLIIGHRGTRAYRPENTLISFRKAVEQKADYVELDVHLSKDRKLIVMHDETLQRTTDGQGKISEKTLDEIKQYRTKLGSQRVPTLEEVLKQFKNKTRFLIELKGKEPAESVCRLIKKNRLEKKVIICSNSAEALLTSKKLLPNTKTALIYYATKTDLREYIFVTFSLMIFPITKSIILRRAAASKADYVSLAYPFATTSFIKKLHSSNYKVLAWVVNSRKVADSLMSKDIDGLITDYPDILKKKLY